MRTLLFYFLIGICQIAQDCMKAYGIPRFANDPKYKTFAIIFIGGGELIALILCVAADVKDLLK
jgi:hypothetical protein